MQVKQVTELSVIAAKCMIDYHAYTSVDAKLRELAVSHTLGLCLCSFVNGTLAKGDSLKHETMSEHVSDGGTPCARYTVVFRFEVQTSQYVHFMHAHTVLSGAGELVSTLQSDNSQLSQINVPLDL